MSLQLKLFGGLSLVDGDTGIARVTRRHRLAVLAVLASATGAVPRERLLALLWPDSGDDSARHALGQVLYGLRQDAAVADLVTGTTDLALNRNAIDCDLWAFRNALGDSDAEAAVALYAGPFLDGVRLPDGGQFDRWADEQRALISRDVQKALEGLATEATRDGRDANAVGWWRKLVQLDPLSSRVAVAYMRALAAAGDRAAAIQHARVHAALVVAELETQPDPAVTALATALRTASATPDTAGPKRTAASAATVPTPEATHVRTPGDAHAEPVPPKPTPSPALTVVSSTAAPSASLPSPSHRRSGTPWLVGALTVTALVAATALINRNAADTSPAVPPGVASNGDAIPVAAVMPFTVRGDSSRTFLGDALAALLSERLDAPGVFRTLESNAVITAVGERAGAAAADARATNVSVDPGIARLATIGATALVRGTIVVLNNRLEIDAELRGIGDAESRTVRAHASGSVDSLFALADRLSTDLLAGRLGRRYQVAALGGQHSVAALKALLAGERALRAWQLFDAIASYRAAVAIDSTYGFAWYRLAFAERWAESGDGVLSAQRAHQFAAQLPDRYAMLLAALESRHDGKDEQAERELLTLVQRYPDDADPWSELGEFRMHVGPLYGHPTSDAEAPLVRTLALDSAGHPEVRFHLTQLALERGDLVRARMLARPLLKGGAAGDRSVQAIRVALVLAEGARDSVAAIVQSLRNAPASYARRTLLLAAISSGITRAAHEVAESLSTTANSREHQRSGLAALMEMNAALNDVAATQRAGASLAALDSIDAASEWATIAQAPDFGVPAERWRNAGDVLERASGGAAARAATHSMLGAALLALRAGDAPVFEARMSRLKALAASDGDMRVLRGLQALLARDSTAFTRALGTFAGPVDWQTGRVLRAEWSLQHGRFDEARGWYLATTWGPAALVLTKPAFEGAGHAAALQQRSDSVTLRDRGRFYTRLR